MKAISTMRLLGGRPCLDLVNTVDARRDSWGPDLLTEYEDLLEWCGRVDLLDITEIAEARTAAAVDGKGASKTLARIKKLREAIAAIMSAIAEHRVVPEHALTAFADEAARARIFQKFDIAGAGFGWVWGREDPCDRPLHRVALDAATLLADERLRPRIKLCPGPNCGWLFLDETKNGSRRWCRDDGCGVHVRVRRYRAKRS